MERPFLSSFSKCFFISKALQQRQIQQTPTSIGDEINAILVSFQWVSKHLLNEDKASGGCHGLFICAKAKRQQQMFSVAKAKRQLQLRQGEIDLVNILFLKASTFNLCYITNCKECIIINFSNNRF